MINLRILNTINLRIPKKILLFKYCWKHAQDAGICLIFRYSSVMDIVPLNCNIT